MKMKIQKKEKQLSNLKVLNHSPMSDASVNFDYKSPSPFDCSTDQEEKIEDVARHCLPQQDLYTTEEEADTLFPRKVTSCNGMEDSGGGGTGVKKKRKKKEPGEQEGAAKGNKDREPKPKRKREPKEPKEPRKTKELKKAKEPKEPKTPKAPKIPKEPKEKKAKTTTPKPKSSKKSSNKKSDSEGSALKKKVNKGKTEGSENSDLDKTPPPSPPPEEDEDPGIQKRRSSRQVKRKRYTEDLEFRISDEEADDADAAGRDSPSNTSQSEQQESVDAEGPVVEKIMSSRSVKKQMCASHD